MVPITMTHPWFFGTIRFVAVIFAYYFQIFLKGRVYTRLGHRCCIFTHLPRQVLAPLLYSNLFSWAAGTGFNLRQGVERIQ